MTEDNVTTAAMASREIDENVKYPIAPAKPLENEMAAKAEVECSGVSLNKSAMTALLVFSYKKTGKEKGINEYNSNQFKDILYSKCTETYPSTTSKAINDQIRNNQCPCTQLRIGQKKENETGKGQANAANRHHHWFAKGIR